MSCITVCMDKYFILLNLIYDCNDAKYNCSIEFLLFDFIFILG